jgi:processive 1,2-diacylglycerol beta-glucosyltransferase
VKRILILTSGFGEGHNAAARGVRDGLAKVAGSAVEVEMRDLVAEAYPNWFKIVSKTYVAIVDHLPWTWGAFYDWLEEKDDFDRELWKFARLREQLARLVERFPADVIVSVFPPYPYVVDHVFGCKRSCNNVAIVTDSITVNEIWYRSHADYLCLPNEQSAEIVRAGGVTPERIKVFGFPVSPKFAEINEHRQSPGGSRPRLLYMINAGTRRAPALVKRLLDLDIDLTVTVGRNEQLRHAIEAVAAGNHQVDIVGWTDELPRMLCASHLLIGKAGGATVQETIAAACPMIINHIVSGQEEGNARLIEQTNSGVIARLHDDVIAQVQRAFANDAKQWREWTVNISKLSRPRAALDIAEFLLSL